MSDVGSTDAELTPAGALLYAAHSAVAQRRWTEAQRREKDLPSEGDRRHGEHSFALGTWVRYLRLSGHALDRTAPHLARQARAVGAMLTPGTTYSALPSGGTRGDVLNAMLRDRVAEKHQAQALAIDLSTLATMPDDLSPAAVHLLAAAGALVAPDGDATATPFDADLRRLAGRVVTRTGLITEQFRPEVERLLDLAHRELEDDLVEDLASAAERVRLSRSDLEQLVRSGVLPRLEENNSLHVNLGVLRRTLGLPFTFTHLQAPRIEGNLAPPAGLIHFVHGPAPTELGNFADGHLEFLPRDREVRDAIARGGHRQWTTTDLRIDEARFAPWVRGWSRDRFGTTLEFAETWDVVRGHALEGGVQSVAVFNRLRPAAQV